MCDYLLAELTTHVFDGDRGVFNRVMQQAGCDGSRVQLHVCQYHRYFERMNEIGFAGGARLSLMMLQGVLVSLLDDREIVFRTVPATLASSSLNLAVSSFCSFCEEGCAFVAI